MCPKHQAQYWKWLDNDKPLVSGVRIESSGQGRPVPTWERTHAIVCQQVDAIKRECQEGLTCGSIPSE